MQAVRRELEDVEGRIDVWTLWQKLSDEHRAALQRQSQLERAWDAYKSLEAELRSRRRALRDEFPEAAEAPADTGERLDELLALKSERAAGRRQLEAELTALQQRCRELVREWEQYVAERARWSEHEARLREQFAVFEEADDEARALLAAYGATKEALALQAERARAELHRRREAQAALARERARFDEAYGDLDPLNDDAVAAVDERIALLNERAELSSALDARRQAHEKAKRRHVGLRLAAAAAAWFVAAAAYFMEAPVWLPAASALIGVIAAVCGGRREAWCLRAGAGKPRGTFALRRRGAGRAERGSGRSPAWTSRICARCGSGSWPGSRPPRRWPSGRRWLDPWTERWSGSWPRRRPAWSGSRPRRPRHGPASAKTWRGRTAPGRNFDTNRSGSGRR